MKKLIQLEFIKYSRSLLFYAFIGLFIIMMGLILVINIYLKKGTGLKFGFPMAWDNVVWLASWLNFFLGLMLVISVTSEQQYRTVRQHIVDGLSKNGFFTAKVLYALLLSVFAVIFIGIVVIAAGMYDNPKTDLATVFTGSKIMARYFVQLAGYLSMALFFGFLFRNTALAMLVYLFYMPIDSLLGVIIFKNPNNVFPKTLFASVVPKPAILNIAQGASGLKMTGPTDQEILLLAIGYILVFIGGAYILFRRRDV